MNYKFLRLTGFLSILMLFTMLESCVKSRDGFTDFSKTSDFVTLVGSGLSNFKTSNLLVNTSSPDTIELTVMANLASAQSKDGAVTATIGLDNSVIAAYNAANGTNFQPFPTNAFKIVSPTITIPGGLEHTGTTTVWIFQDKLDPIVSYLLPVALTDASGKTLSGNQNIIYYNVIGNILAGTYSQNFKRWNGTTDTTTAPNGTAAGGTNSTVVIPAISATSILLPEGYIVANFGQTAGVALSFTNTNGVLSNFTVSEESNTKADMEASNFHVTTLKLLNADLVGTAATKYAGSRFRIYTEILNNAGAVRATINTFIKQ